MRFCLFCFLPCAVSDKEQNNEREQRQYESEILILRLHEGVIDRMIGHRHDQKRKGAGYEQFFLLMYEMQSESHDAGADAVHQRGSETAKQRPKKRDRGEVLQKDHDVFEDREADAERKSDGEKFFSVVREHKGEDLSAAAKAASGGQ